MLINIFFCDGKFRLEIKKSDFKILDYIQEAKIAATDTVYVMSSTSWMYLSRRDQVVSIFPISEWKLLKVGHCYAHEYTLTFACIVLSIECNVWWINRCLIGTWAKAVWYVQFKHLNFKSFSFSLHAISRDDFHSLVFCWQVEKESEISITLFIYS